MPVMNNVEFLIVPVTCFKISFLGLELSRKESNSAAQRMVPIIWKVISLPSWL